MKKIVLTIISVMLAVTTSFVVFSETVDELKKRFITRDEVIAFESSFKADLETIDNDRVAAIYDELGYQMYLKNVTPTDVIESMQANVSGRETIESWEKRKQEDYGANGKVKPLTGYLELDYVHFDNSNTNNKCAVPISLGIGFGSYIEYKANVYGAMSQDRSSVCGVTSSTANKLQLKIFRGSLLETKIHYAISNTGVTVSVPYDGLHTWNITNKKGVNITAYMDDTLLLSESYTTTSGKTNSNAVLMIGGTFDSEVTNYSNFTNFKGVTADVYYVKVLAADGKLHEFIPAMELGTGRVGFYDACPGVTTKFYGLTTAATKELTYKMKDWGRHFS